ncbi:MAG: hypothetical protein HWD86_12035, partial [Kangiellaceae bacterium]|nr:hypothetical protein [Kangiellaceae bacterium]
AQGANCNLINNELYCASSDMDLVNNVIINIGLKELPADRSILLEMPGLYEAVISELNKRDFHYTVKNLGSESWIIVEQEDLELFNQIKNQKIYEMRMAENQ